MVKLVGDKAEAFAEEASALGWETEIARNGSKATVTASLDEKVLSISWKGGACLNEVFLEIDGHQKKLRNAAAARRKLIEEAGEDEGHKGYDRPVREEKPKQSVQKKSKAANGVEVKTKPVPFKSTRKPRTILPFDPDTASDVEILQAVVGKRITWKNSISGAYDDARVMARPNQKHLRIDFNRKQERCITFAEADADRHHEAGGGFRSVRVKSIVSVTTK